MSVCNNMTNENRTADFTIIKPVFLVYNILTISLKRTTASIKWARLFFVRLDVLRMWLKKIC